MIDRIIRPKELVSIFGISKSTFYAWQDQNSKYFKSDFPKKLV